MYKNVLDTKIVLSLASNYGRIGEKTPRTCLETFAPIFGIITTQICHPPLSRFIIIIIIRISFKVEVLTKCLQVFILPTTYVTNTPP